MKEKHIDDFTNISPKVLSDIRNSLHKTLDKYIDQMLTDPNIELSIKVIPNKKTLSKGAKIYKVTAHWQLGPGAISKDYEGYGPTKEAAIENARNFCKLDYQGTSTANYCMNQPTYKCAIIEDCGDCWTDWVNWGGSVGSCCPAGCNRGREVEQIHRIGATKHRFLCDSPGKPCD